MKNADFPELLRLAKVAATEVSNPCSCKLCVKFRARQEPEARLDHLLKWAATKLTSRDTYVDLDDLRQLTMLLLEQQGYQEGDPDGAVGDEGTPARPLGGGRGF